MAASQNNNNNNSLEFKLAVSIKREMERLAPQFSCVSANGDSVLRFSSVENPATEIRVDPKTRLVWVWPDVGVYEDAAVSSAVRGIYKLISTLDLMFNDTVDPFFIRMLVMQTTEAKKREEAAEVFNALFTARYDQIEDLLQKVQHLQDELNVVISQYRLQVGLDDMDADVIHGGGGGGGDEEDSMVCYDS